MMHLNQKVYLGDAVYAQLDGADLVLTTENGIAVTNTIYLDREVIAALLKMLIQQGVIVSRETEGGATE